MGLSAGEVAQWLRALAVLSEAHRTSVAPVPGNRTPSLLLS